MIQLLQSLSTGATELIEAPVPLAGGPNLLVEGRCSLISSGTERMLVEFGRAGWLDKARQQPDKVAQVLSKVRTEGLASTLEAVRSKLDQPIPLGYCHAGVVVEAGPAAGAFAPGDRVVSNGPHAEFVSVPWTLAAKIPDGVSFEAASFTPLAAIGLQGLRLAEPTLGETVVVYGLGVIGLLTVQLVRANGCRAIGIDTDPAKLALAERMGATVVSGEGDVGARVSALTGGQGVDAVLLTLAAASDEPLHHAAVMCRKRGRIVLVGVTGLDLKRDDFYRKELSFTVSCSYGPGRYDPEYEQRGRDYPLPYVRWTEQRNMSAVLDLMAAGSLDPLPLVSHRFPFAEAPRAYDLLTGSEPSLGVVLDYGKKDDAPATAAATVRTVTTGRAGAVGDKHLGVGVIGAGNFAARVLIPALLANGFHPRAIASASGTSAAVAGRKFGFERVTSDVAQLLSDPEVGTVVVATRHDSHARLAIQALEAGKNVFVEKPLALVEEDLDRIDEALQASGRTLTVGFNRRFAPLARELRARIESTAASAALVLTVNAGAIPAEHWTQDRGVGGGRIVGEACHFIDLARYLAGSPITSLDVTIARRPDETRDDVANLSIRFANGSTAVVHYLANGASSFPKERIEAFSGGSVWQIDNWRRLRSYGASSASRARPFAKVQKGHQEEMAALAASLRAGGAPPIPYEELLEVSRWAIRAAARASAATGAP